jgi:hypothetical protein
LIDRFFNPITHPYVYDEYAHDEIEIATPAALRQPDPDGPAFYEDVVTYRLVPSGRYIPGYGYEYTLPWLKEM